MSTVFSGTIWKGIKRTLRKVLGDDSGDVKMVARSYVQMGSMEDAYVDDPEYGASAFAEEMGEGEEIPTVSIFNGNTKRYLARKFGCRMVVTEEAMDDSKYPTIIKAASRCRLAMDRTKEYDCALLLARGWNTSYIGADGLPLFSASPTIPGGGTFSNTLSTPLPISTVGLRTIANLVYNMPGYDGARANFMTEGLVVPNEQYLQAVETVTSRYVPESNNNAVNVVNTELDLGKPIRVPFWDNTSTNWAVKTNADDGLQLLVRRGRRVRQWVENSQETQHNAITERWATGWTNARSMVGSQF